MTTNTQDRATHGAQAGTALPGLLTFETAADYLSVSTSTIRRLIRSGDISAVPVRNALRIPSATVLAYVDRLSAKAQEAATA